MSCRRSPGRSLPRSPIAASILRRWSRTTTRWPSTSGRTSPARSIRSAPAAWARLAIRDAVTDPAGRVRGVAGLRVIDASIMPTIPRGNTNIPTIMVAEKLAAEMLAEGMICLRG